MNPVIELAIREAASDLGIYPQSITEADGKVRTRTEWQEGWNAAAMEMCARLMAADAWFKSLPVEIAEPLAEMVNNDALFLSINKEHKVTKALLLMSDTFAYACADAEEVPPEAYPEITALWRGFGSDGLTAWVAKRRGCEPIEPWQTEKYRAARKHLE